MICFYHRVDADGWCSGAVVAKYTGCYEESRFIGMNYYEDFPVEKITHQDTVYIVDLSFKEDTVYQLKEIIERAKDVVWIDHHDSSILLEKSQKWTRDVPGIRSKEHSAAWLCWDYFFKNRAPDVVRLVSDHDTWAHSMTDSVAFNYGIGMEDTKPTGRIWFDLFRGVKLKNVVENGKAAERYAASEKATYLENFGYESELDGVRCYVVNRSTNSLIFGHKYDEYPLVVTWVFNGEYYKYSLFSGDKSINCEEIAGRHGGGGHRGAAGFKSDQLLVKKEC